MSANVLVVEDDAAAARALQTCLEVTGYSVVTAGHGAQALRLAVLRPFDVVLLDLGLPDMHGREICERLRQWSEIPVVVISGSRSLDDKIAMLDAGADQYLEKPFLPGELLARLRATLRRARGTKTTTEPAVRFGQVEVDLALREVRRGGAPVHLTPHEFGVLAELARHPGAVITYPDLLRSVWGHAYEKETQYLWVCMRHLRVKLEVDPSHPRHLITQARVGYRLRILKNLPDFDRV